MLDSNEAGLPRLRTRARVVDIAAKIGLVLLPVIAIAYPDLGLGSLGSILAGVIVYALRRRWALHDLRGRDPADRASTIRCSNGSEERGPVSRPREWPNLLNSQAFPLVIEHVFE
jgi:hypothetical protein